MPKTRMKFLIPTYIASQIDLFRIQEYMRPFYPDSKIIILNPSHHILKVHLCSGKFDIGKIVNFSSYVYVHASGCILYTIELDDKIESIINNRFSVYNKSYQFTINNQDIKTSFNALNAEFYVRLRRLNTIQEAMTKWGSISDLNQEMLDNSGVDFLLFGKDRVLSDFGGIFSSLIIEETPSSTDTLEKIATSEEIIFIQDRTIIYATKESSISEILLGTILTNFYYWQTDISTIWLQEMEKDIAGLRHGFMTKGNIGWEWEIQEFDIKRLNFLKYLPYYRSLDNTFLNLNLPPGIRNLFNINDFKTSVNANLNAIQFTITEIDRMVEEKQAASTTRRSKNLEYLITIIGGLGGMAAILAVFFAGGLKLESKIFAILLLILIPISVVIFEFLVRKSVARRSREVYIKTKINNLAKYKQQTENMLKSYQEQGAAVPEEFSQLLLARLKRTEKEIEELSKRK